MDIAQTAFAVSWAGEAETGAQTLQKEQQLNRFLADVERRALRIVEISVRDRDEALDIVQDSMISLARNYGTRDSAEWRPLFYRILQNRVRDWHRRQAVRRRVLVWFGGGRDDESGADAVQSLPDPAARSPEREVAQQEAMRCLEAAIGRLPPRQREAFVLRNFEGLDVAGTAVAMGCGEGSVKTHYSRAVHALRQRLEEHGPFGAREPET